MPLFLRRQFGGRHYFHSLSVVEREYGCAADIDSAPAAETAAATAAESTTAGAFGGYQPSGYDDLRAFGKIGCFYAMSGLGLKVSHPTAICSAYPREC